MKPLILILILILAASAHAQSRPQQSAPPSTAAGSAARGKVAFMSAGCYTCHGTVGQGGAGARLAPKPRAAAAFMAYVRSGRRGWSVAGGMPAYPASVLSDAALGDIYAYLSSIPLPPSASQIQLLRD
jgi:ubiquinol-cytochrome c reductase cytochrome c subunit